MPPPKEATGPRRLGNYVESIYYGGRSPPPAGNRPFNNGKARNPPMLRPRGVNRILMFPGSFNPPHTGHLELLRHVFENAGHDLHIVAAIVIVTDDERLAEKMAEADNPFLLTKEQRVALWNGNGIPVDWAWVFDKSEAMWHAFRSRLERAVAEDGIELRFILLGGPDWISANSIFDPTYWKCADAITSDVSRPVDFRYPNSLRQLSGHSMWERPKFELAILERQIRAKLNRKPREVVERTIALAAKNIREAWVCRRLLKPKGMVRFIPCNLNTRPSQPPSSTHIRGLISALPDGESLVRLRSLVLNANILINYVRQSRTLVGTPQGVVVVVKERARQRVNQVVQ